MLSILHLAVAQQRQIASRCSFRWRGFSSLLRHVANHPPERVALVHCNSDYSYGQLLSYSRQWSQQIASKTDRKLLAGARIAYMCSRDPCYVVMQWATWMLDGVTVPLHPHASPRDIAFVLADADVSVVVCDEEYRSLMQKALDQMQHQQREFHVQYYNSSKELQLIQEVSVPLDIGIESISACNLAAQILYTSGTTGRPKGVVMTHNNLAHQMRDLVTMWALAPSDRLLHFLPLHHTHGILCKLLAPLYAGGTIEMMPSANVKEIWQRIAESPVTVLMGVPTIYMNLLEGFPNIDAEIQKAALNNARNHRVHISGSMACPVSIHERWELLTGQRLLERYGMTELGMALSCGLPIAQRVHGYVGKPLPSVRVKIVANDGDIMSGHRSDESNRSGTHGHNVGELYVKGENVFREYWRLPEATHDAFDKDGWFRTGDVVQYDIDLDSYRILGRASVDIIKTGGYKVSALEIERIMLEHPLVAECCVVGLPDEKWGETIGAWVRPVADLSHSHHELTSQLQQFCSENMSSYRRPRTFNIVKEIPKNAMGKINKRQIVTEYIRQE